jgi:hypothetical protein
MYRTKDTRQLELEDFYLPFGGHLNPNNRWVELAQLIPWEEFEEKYAEHFAEKQLGGIAAKPFRMALGALLIKEKLGITDRETVQQIRETPHLQFLIGMQGYRDEDPFDPSLMVHFRKRITAEMLNEINERIHEEQIKKNEKLKKKLKRKKRLR